MRFAVARNDTLVRELVRGLYREDEPYAETCRRVGTALQNAGFRRASYELIRRLAGQERRRREARRRVRRARREVAEAFFLTSRVVNTPIALERLETAKAHERLVTQWHERPFDPRPPP